MSTMIPEPVRIEDEGYFGPDSVAWRVAGPTLVPALWTTGFMFFLSPQNIEIGSQGTSAFSEKDPYLLDRARQTLEYAFAVVYGDRRTADHAVEVVNSLHDNVNGKWAPTGEKVHRASDPSNALWLLIPFGQALLDAYDRFGPKKLTAEERDQFWRDENTILGRLNRIPDDRLPKSQKEADEYIESQRDKLAIHPYAAKLFGVLFPSLLWGSPILPGPLSVPMHVLGSGGNVLLEDWALELAGQRQYPRPVKWLFTQANRAFFAPLVATPVLRDLIPLMLSQSARQLIRRSRAAARTGVYDTPTENRKVTAITVTA